MRHSALQKSICALLIGLCPALGFAADVLAASDKQTAAMVRQTGPDSQQMEQKLQQLSWSQFRFIVESVPKLRADVEAYGPIGWEYLKARYASFGWKKSIDKLDDAQKRGLADLLQAANASGGR